MPVIDEDSPGTALTRRRARPPPHARRSWGARLGPPVSPCGLTWAARLGGGRLFIWKLPLWRLWRLHNCRIVPDCSNPAATDHKLHPLSTFSSLLSRFLSLAMATTEYRGKPSPSSGIGTMDTAVDGGQLRTPIGNWVQNESKVTRIDV